MLCDINYFFDPIADAIAIANGNNTEVIRVQEGIYQIGHFSFDNIIDWPIDNDGIYPKLENFNCYGVCDNYKQVLEQCQEIQSQDRKFVVSITPIEKSKQPARGGWRWHKWGPYIGEKTPTCEYLYNEKDIELVYCYHIYEIK